MQSQHTSSRQSLTIEQRLVQLLEFHAGTDYSTLPEWIKNFVADAIDEFRHRLESDEPISPLMELPSEQQQKNIQNHNNLFLTDIIEYLPVGILQQEIDEKHRVISEHTNKTFVELTGYSLEEYSLLSQNQRSKLIHQDDSIQLEESVQEWLTESSDIETISSVLRIHYRFLHPFNGWRWFENFMQRCRIHHAGESTPRQYIIQAVFDITQRQEHEKNLQHFASYLEQTIKPILEISPDGAITYINRACRVTFPDIDHAGISHPLLSGFASIVEMERNNGFVHQHHVHVNEHYYEQHWYYLAQRNVLRVFNHDITAMKNAEEELRTALKYEQTLTTMRSRFLETISHEFRTPLTGISTSTEILYRYSDKMSETERSQSLGDIRNRVVELTSLIDEFIIQSSTGSLGSSFKLREANIAVIIDSILTELSCSFSEKNLTLYFDSSIAKLVPLLLCDERLLRHALRNLLRNAINYTPDGGNISCGVQQTVTSLSITISDTGIGIPEKEIHTIFDASVRGTNATHVQGSGLGLAIAREFIELHNGTITLKSTVGSGTICTVHLPLNASIS